MYEFIFEHVLLIHNRLEHDNWAFVKPKNYISGSQKYARHIITTTLTGLDRNIKEGAWYYNKDQI